MENLFGGYHIDIKDNVIIRTIDDEKSYTNVSSITETNDFVYLQTNKIFKAFLKNNIVSIQVDYDPTRELDF